jgi:hypothetical protein
LGHLRFVLPKLREVNLKLNPRKCEFVNTSLTFLKHVVSRDGTQLDPKYIKAIIDFPISTSFTNVRALLGLIRYYQNYVMGYSWIAMPLFDLTKKDIVFEWNHNYQDVFDLLKTTLASTPILIRLNFSRAFILDVIGPLEGLGQYYHKRKGGMNGSLHTLTKVCFLFKRSSTPWKVNVMCQFGG